MSDQRCEIDRQRRRSGSALRAAWCHGRAVYIHRSLWVVSLMQSIAVRGDFRWWGCAAHTESPLVHEPTALQRTSTDVQKNDLGRARHCKVELNAHVVRAPSSSAAMVVFADRTSKRPRRTSAPRVLQLNLDWYQRAQPVQLCKQQIPAHEIQRRSICSFSGFSQMSLKRSTAKSRINEGRGVIARRYPLAYDMKLVEEVRPTCAERTAI